MFRTLENDDALIRNFDTVIARGAADLAQAYRVRYQVYCVENTFEDPADNPGGLERDLFDERASHCLLVYRPVAPWPAPRAWSCRTVNGPTRVSPSNTSAPSD